MAKLYFRYGAMGAAKSANLLMVAYNYRMQGKRVVLMKPKTDSRDPWYIESRTGLRERVDYVIPDVPMPFAWHASGADCVLVDEAQFLPPRAVEELRFHVAWSRDIPVICYGLRADFRSRLFPGSKRLMELADSIEEIKTICAFCERKATQNLRLVEGEDQVMVGGDGMYAAACFGCFKERQNEWWYATSE